MEPDEAAGPNRGHTSGSGEGGRSESASPLPALSLPKGGGAIRGIGEKFTANPVTGSGSISVPIYLSPSRSSLSPQLSLAYDSSSGNGPFGFGWTLSLPSITRKTDKGIPRYADFERSDTFILSGAEDLIPLLVLDGAGHWVPEQLPLRPLYGRQYQVSRYRPRVEGLFARIERWSNPADATDTFWRSISKDNVTSWYGLDEASRIQDPAEASHIFGWLICVSHDDKGNVIQYSYKQENTDLVDLTQANERNRTRTAARYITHVRYGNRTPFFPDLTAAAATPLPSDWCFELVFDYGSHDPGNPLPTDSAAWECRPDPFSKYRSGFEIRTYRRCRRVLMFHHFPSDPEILANCLVRSTDLTYAPDPSPPDPSRPIYSLLRAVTQTGYRRNGPGAYFSKSLPAVEFRYTEATIDETLRNLPPDAVENLPSGVDDTSYRWIDLDGEGAPGVLTEQGGRWLYKANLSPANQQTADTGTRTMPKFAPVETVSRLPSLASLGSGQHLMDLSGNGRLDLALIDGDAPGFYERTDDGDWEPFQAFDMLPVMNWRGTNLRFVDLTGDGMADILLTEDDAISWRPSRGQAGFGSAVRMARALDEERGPQLVLSTHTETIFLADISGDGLADLVRVRNGAVCYWPNLGYGRFGPKVTMDGSPWFEGRDLFDASRVLFADIDGSGTADLIYVASSGIRIYFNQSGNAWGTVTTLAQFPQVESASQVAALDLLGTGTACLTWSSPLATNARRPMRYIDLLSGVKPHLLVGVTNNLGAETHIQYAPSTKFYVADKMAGTPWLTRLPFPVHVVERVEVFDFISRNRFVTRYAYHHGFFDGIEREFRGFGRVDMWDTQELTVLTAAGVPPVASNDDARSNLPPVRTKTWYHTGAFFEDAAISRQFQAEYYSEGGLTAAQQEAMLLPDTVMPVSIPLPTGARLPYTLGAEEMREACRALQGSMLRQEIYAEDDSGAAGRPYSVSERNFTVDILQPRGDNPFGVFFTHERELLEFNYERTLFVLGSGALVADPRVTHTATLAIDPFANLLLTASVSYGRRHADPALSPADQAKQRDLQCTFTRKSYTNPIATNNDWRIPLPSAATTYELLQAVPAATLPGVTNLFRVDELSSLIAGASDGTHDVLFEDRAPVMNGGETYRRVIESSRTLYRPDDMGEAAGDPATLLALGNLEPLALPGAAYKLAFTPGLISQVYQRGGALLPTPATVMASRAGDGGGYVDVDGDGHWWAPAGRAYHTAAPVPAAAERAQARAHFFLPRRYEDPFGNVASVDVDGNDLLVIGSRDALSNTTTVVNDYRVLKVAQLTDPNGNVSAVSFDVLGLVSGTCAMGKPAEQLGDSLAGFAPDLSAAQIDSFFEAADPHLLAASLLGSATTRIVYDHDRFTKSRAAAPNDPSKWQPVFSSTLVRETHTSDLAAGQVSAIQIAFGYSDGFGREAQKKTQAEPGAVVPGGPTVTPRWAAGGWTIFNNKGLPVRQYEPFFSRLAKGHHFEFGTQTGVSSIVFYDPMERVVGAAHPEHTFEKIVFTPWNQQSWDQSDTVNLDPATDPDVGGFFSRLPASEFQPTWRQQRAGGAMGSAEQEAATKAAAHAGTPLSLHFDVLGRTILTVADNAADGRYESRVFIDIQGNELSAVDALGRVVAKNDYDVLKRPIRRAGIDAGLRWVLNDASGKPIRAWDSRGHNVRTAYDTLRRPAEMFVAGVDPARSDPRTLGGEKLSERIVYGEGQPNDVALNLRTRVYEHRDSSGILINWGRNPVSGLDEGFDFKGNLLRNRRQFLADYKGLQDWSAAAPALDADVFMSGSRFDAMNRPIAVFSADSSIVRPSFNAANLLEAVSVQLKGAATATPFVTGVDYNARGQRSAIAYGNQTTSEYHYDPLTFRLISAVTTRPAFPVNARVVQDLSYVFDPVGNITHIQDDSDIQNTIYFQNQRVDPSTDYTYDAVYRLIEASGREHLGLNAGGTANAPAASSYDDLPRIRRQHPSDGRAMGTYTERYEYDDAGNFQKWIHRGANPAHPGWTRTYAYAELSAIAPTDLSNRLTSTTVNGGVPFVEPYVYDAHGNLTSMPQLQAVQWNCKDEMQMARRQAVNAEDADGAAHLGERTFYVYDASGQRLRKVTESTAGVKIKERLYLGGFERYREFDAVGAVTLERDTLNIVDNDRRIARVDTKSGPAAQNVIRFQYDNHLGSATLELDQSGAVVTYEEYFPYGGTSYQAGISAAEISLKRYRFTGKERDEETGFYYHGARYYPPWLGRWMQCDPAGTADGLNSYVYSLNNPVRHTDPNGMQSRDDVMRQIKKSGKAVHVMTPATKKKDGTIAKPGGTGNVYLGPRPKATAPNPGNTPPPKPPPKKGAGTGGSGKGTDPVDQAGNGSKSQEGSATGDPKGDKKDASDPKQGGDGGQGGTQKVKKTELDYTVLLAHELNPPFVDTLMDFLMGKNEDNTVETGGIPGGKGSKDNASEAAQAAFVAINLVFTFVGEVAQGLKAVVGRIKGASAFNKLASELNLGKEASEGLLGAKNTGKCFVGKVNCGFVSVASADPVPSVGSSQVAQDANLVEGLSTKSEVGTMLRERGLGSGHPDISMASRADATTFMKGMPVGTKFVVTYGRTGGGIGHVVNAEVTSVGLVFYDNQRLLGGLRPSLSLEGAAANIDVFTTYNPNW